MKRLLIIIGLLLSTCCSLLWAQQLPYTVPESKRVRVIVSSDAANEVDDAFMIMHALLTPQFDIRGIVAAHFRDRRPRSMELSYQEVQRLLEKSHIPAPLYRGASIPMANASTHSLQKEPT